MIDAIYNAGLNLLSFGWWTGIVWPCLLYTSDAADE